jgi:hypothetical protein
MDDDRANDPVDANGRRTTSGDADRGELDEALLEGLAPSLLWRVGRLSDDGPVTVRVGFATAAPLFAELPRLRNATDGEVEQAVRERSLAVEWVGPRPR